MVTNPLVPKLHTFDCVVTPLSLTYMPSAVRLPHPLSLSNMSLAVWSLPFLAPKLFTLTVTPPPVHLHYLPLAVCLPPLSLSYPPWAVWLSAPCPMVNYPRLYKRVMKLYLHIYPVVLSVLQYYINIKYSPFNRCGGWG